MCSFHSQFFLNGKTLHDINFICDNKHEISLVVPIMRKICFRYLNNRYKGIWSCSTTYIWLKTIKVIEC